MIELCVSNWHLRMCRMIPDDSGVVDDCLNEDGL